MIANARRGGLFRAGAKEPFVFAAGRLWDRAKNIGALAKAARELSWEVMLAGASDRDYTQPNVTQLGRLTEPQMADWLRRASIVALPARYEPFGLVALEAALSGCALVLGDIPSFREVWGDAASYVDPEDERVLHDAIEALIADPAALRASADRARQRASTYSARRMARLYRGVYECACGRHPVDRRSLPCAS